jgi:hypothetical protein
MKNYIENFAQADGIKIGPIELSVLSFLSVYAALAVMAFAIAGAVGVVPGTVTSTAELLSMNVIWGALMVLISFVLTRFCVAEQHRFLRVPMMLVGAGVLIGSILAVVF